MDSCRLDMDCILYSLPLDKMIKIRGGGDLLQIKHFWGLT